MRIGIKTLGCKSNRYESDKIFDELKKYYEVFEVNEGASTFLKEECFKSDLLIVNTCTVTHVADRKSRQAIRSFKHANPDCKIIAFGCGINVSPDSYKEMDEIDYTASDAAKVLEIAKKLAKESGGKKFERCEYEGTSKIFGHGFRKRALIKIQDGCNSFCSYCIIPMARGPQFSFPSKEILREVQEKEALGFLEIVLTGINIAEWEENGKDLADLIEMLIAGTLRVRFRVSSIEPKNFSEKFFELFKTGRLCPHLHMSLQSGSGSVLIQMRRHYTTDVFEDVCQKLRKVVPEISLTTDVIVGFPGESEEQFQETCAFVERIGFLKIHVFPYSKRAKTVAARMKNQIPDFVKKERCKRLRTISNCLGRKFMKSLVGREYEVLVESNVDGLCCGFTNNYIPVQFFCSEKRNIVNSIVKVRLEKVLDQGVVMSELI